MPHVIVKLMAGRSEQAKTQLAGAIVKDVVTFANVGEESVSVSIEDVQPQDWDDKVFEPEIRLKRATLYKKPGYKPV